MSHAPSDLLRRRHQAIRQAFPDRNIDALVVTSLPNVLYLTNFTGSAALVILTADRLELVTDSRYVTAAQALQRSCPELELTTVEGSYDATLTERLAALGSPRVGVEAAHITLARHGWLTTALERAGGRAGGVVLVPTEGIIERARVRKDAYEIDTLREAARRLSAVAAGVLAEDVARGRTEQEVALAIDWRIRKAGFSRAAFETIVASGPNSALPHARPGERTLGEGDLVVLDFGGVYTSYCVDLTRTVSIGRPSPRARAVHAAVLDAHDQAIRAVKPGASRLDIDATARDALARHGLAEAFGHSTGHGLGLEVHEDPRIAKRRADIDTRDEAVEPGMVFTIEPGAYLPEWGGVRIEDDVLVTPDGVELLTSVTTELIEI
jgi:Xaa-Pro aminopeptidase